MARVVPEAPSGSNPPGSFVNQKVEEIMAAEDYFQKTYQNKAFKYAEEEALPAMMSDFLKIIDTAGNGELSAKEMDEAADIIRIAKTGKQGNSSKLNYKHLPETVSQVLSTWDLDNSGTVGVHELVAAAEAQKRMKDENRLMKRVFAVVVIVTLLLLGSILPLSWTAAEIAKDTKTDQDTGVLSTFSGTSVSTASSVERGALADLPGLGVDKLRELRDFGYDHDDVYHHRMLSGFNWHSSDKVELIATNGEVLIIDASNSAMLLQKPSGAVVTLGSSSGRRLGEVAGGGEAAAAYSRAYKTCEANSRSPVQCAAEGLNACLAAGGDQESCRTRPKGWHPKLDIPSCSFNRMGGHSWPAEGSWRPNTQCGGGRRLLDINQKVYIEGQAVLGDGTGTCQMNTCMNFVDFMVGDPRKPLVKVCGTGIKMTVYLLARCGHLAGRVLPSSGMAHTWTIGTCDTSRHPSSCQEFDPGMDKRFGAVQSYKIEKC